MSDPTMLEFEENLSAIQDGEMEGEALLATIDELVERDELRAFWRQSRSMQKALAAAPDGPAEAPPDAVWRNVEKASGGRSRPKVIRLETFKPQVWAAAASIILVFSLTLAGLFRGAIPGEANARVIQLGSAEGTMTEHRFLEITTELLQADSRYHRKMLEVMQTVNREAYGLSGELRSEESAPRSEGEGRARTPAARDPEGADATAAAPTNPEDTQRRRTSNEDDRAPVRLNLW